MTAAYRVVTLPGDGIGPEVMAATVRVIEAALQRVPDVAVEFQPRPAGAAHYRQTGVALPDETLRDCLAADAVLLSAIGLPDVRKPDNTEIQPDVMIALRRALGLYAAVRPIRLYPGVSSPLKETSQGIDFVILRENLEGLFASYGGGCLVGDVVATDTVVITRQGTEQIVDYAFRLARKRNGRLRDGKRLVTCVDKANIFRSLAFFRKVFYDVAARYADIETEAVYVDAMSLYMVQRPADFDVCVMENQFGDILSDLGAGLVGGLGLAPSAEVGEKHGLFQPSHGSAPTLAGKDLANPLAMILSGSMMFDWLADRTGDAATREVSVLIERAVERVLAEGRCQTADLGGRTGTQSAAEAVIASLQVSC